MTPICWFFVGAVGTVVAVTVVQMLILAIFDPYHITPRDNSGTIAKLDALIAKCRRERGADG